MLERMSAGSVAGIVAVGLAMGCAAPRNGKPSAAVSASASAVSASAVSPSAVSPSAPSAYGKLQGVAGPATPALAVSFEMQAGVGSSTLLLVVPGRAKQALRVVPEPFTCYGVAQSRSQRSLDRSLLGTIGCRPSDSSIYIRREKDAVSFSVAAERVEDRELARIAIAPEQAVQVDAGVRESSAGSACRVDAPVLPIEAKLALRREARRTAWFEVPKLGVSLEVFEIHRPEACDSERVRKRLTFSCVSQEAGSSFQALVERGVLVLSTRFTNYGEDDSSVIGAVKLPCGAQLSWHKLRLRDPEWSGVGTGPCGARCQERHVDCDDRCRMRHADDYHDNGDALTDAGADCLAECELLSQHCGCPQFG